MFTTHFFVFLVFCINLIRREYRSLSRKHNPRAMTLLILIQTQPYLSVPIAGSRRSLLLASRSQGKCLQQSRHGKGVQGVQGVHRKPCQCSCPRGLRLPSLTRSGGEGSARRVQGPAQAKATVTCGGEATVGCPGRESESRSC